jgi:hypothetical protein
MKKRNAKKRSIKYKRTIHRQPDSHTWATKMEIRGLISGKRELKLEPVEKRAV